MTGYNKICLILDDNKEEQVCTTRDWGFEGNQGCGSGQGMCEYRGAAHVSNFVTWQVDPRVVHRVTLLFNHRDPIKIPELTIFHQSMYQSFKKLYFMTSVVYFSSDQAH